MKTYLLLAVLSTTMLFALPSATHGASPIKLELVQVKKVWDQAPHNAFTDLIRFKDKWFMTFREATTHMYDTPAGRVRVLTSNDGETWKSAALLKYETDADDLRDPKLSITPEGRLLLIAGLAPKENHDTRQSLAWLSDDGKTWEGPTKIGEFNWWLWRVAWHPDGTAYGVGYDYSAPRGEWTTRLYRSKDGLNYETLLARLAPQPGANETTLLFREDGSALAVFRRGGEGHDSALVGTSKGDFRQWTFHDLKKRIGGPHAIELPDGNVLVAGRFHDPTRTAIAWLDPKAGTLDELLVLPSNHDTSYPGLVWHDNLLWVSYYSGHEGRTSIYLAKVKVLPAEAGRK
jgi:hypothetical protein